MIDLKRITSVDDPLFQSMYNLCVISFPQNERRSWAALEYVLSYDKHFHANAILLDGKFVGLFNYWLLDRFCFVEHVAVVAAHRGQGIGTRVFDWLKKNNNLPVLLEVELPTNKVAIRRIEFYEKLGYMVVDKPYAQPPYDVDGFLVPMQLMTNELHFVNTHFVPLKRCIYHKVYGYEQDDSNKTSNLNESELPLYC